jgi:Zn-dependent membrane protease YugP
MQVLIPLVVLLALIVGPSLWVNAVMTRYRVPGDRYEKTGGQTARGLLDALELGHVRVESTSAGDHYDPVEKVVRLSQQNFDGRSLTALTVAAHEVGHAMQDALGFGPLEWRTRLVQWVRPIEKVGAGMLMAAPVVVALTRVPGIALLVFVGGLLTLAVGVGVHTLTLPTEFDASFRRALPLLDQQRLLRAEDRGRARRLLAAAALTYVSAALQSLLSIGRWWRILRR